MTTTTAVAAQPDVGSNNQRTIIALAVVTAALVASLAMLALVSASAVDIMSTSSDTNSMVVDARQAIFRP